MAISAVPFHVDDPVNARILAVSEDRVQGFSRYPLHRIADASGVDLDTVVTRIRAMLEAGTIRRVRQTLLSTSLAPGALVAWKVPSDAIKSAFDFMFTEDPFSGHVVTRTTDQETPGSDYKLWTTLKVPRPFDLDAHCRYLASQTGAETYKLLPAKKLFTLGVGHVRRRTIEPGAKTDEPGRVILNSGANYCVEAMGSVDYFVDEEGTPESVLVIHVPGDYGADGAEDGDTGGGGDLPAIEQLEQALERFPGTMLLVTHDLVDAAVLADEVVVLEDGKVRRVGGSSDRAIRRARELGDVWHPSRRSDAQHVRRVKEQHPELRVVPRTTPDKVDAFLEAGAEGAVVSVPDEATLREVARRYR